ncbi:acyltransferase family protein [Aeromonas veronii]|uniref:acyltransferase family protein n=1 Tax=Aeromonas veronii TaxID=654 RepID=UPI002936F2C9|nr:acyltransferase family protein [Aeromonas veronii]WOE87224.1 heparan-alpha-glucosaminide N-acetyltransferase domain-containing protein [Aeromonas veronii]
MSSKLSFLDLARGLAAIFMVCTHVVTINTKTQIAEHSIFGKVITLLGEAPAAPVFMVIMGILYTYKKQHQFTHDIKRSFSLLTKGYYLNFLRLAVPFILFLFYMPFDTNKPDDKLTNFVDDIISNLLVVDILHAAGLSYLIMAIVNKFQFKDVYIIFIILFILVCSPFMWGLGTDVPFWGRLLEPLWGINGDMVSFPLFPWVIYPLTGMILGRRYSNPLTLTTQEMGCQFGFGVCLSFIGILISQTNVSFHFGDYWRTGPGGLVLYIGFIMQWLALMFFISPYIHKGFFNIINFISTYITNFYIVQWILISASIVVLEQYKLDIIESLATIIIIIAMSFLICKKLQKHNINL